MSPNNSPSIIFKFPITFKVFFSWNSSAQERSLEAKNYIARIGRGRQQCKILIMYCNLYIEVGAGLFRIFMQMLQELSQAGNKKYLCIFQADEIT